jgi:hypothetical protein
MQVNGISENSLSTTAWAEALARSKPATSLSSTATPQTVTASSSISAAPVSPASSSGQIQESVSSVVETTHVATYSTTVGGRNYAESVDESGGVYVASVPNPPGASASGGSVQSAENNLNIKLDTLF